MKRRKDLARYCGEDIRCIVTGQYNADLHHVITRGAGGSDEPCNLMPLSHRLHNEVHAIGLTAFSRKYPIVQLWLIGQGWLLVDNRWRNNAARRKIV